VPFPVENAVFDPAETLPRADLAALQLSRLRETVARCAGVPFYREAFAAAGVSPDDVRSLDDLRRLPFTVKDDLRRHYPLGLLAVPRAQVARVHGSSGTTGRPTFVAYTRRDLETWSGLVARFLVAGGVRAGHTVHVAFGYGLFTGGFGLHQGIERVGAAVVPAAGGNTPRQVMLIRDLDPDVLVCTPSYALHIAEVMAAEGVKPGDVALRYGHFGAEPWTEEMRAELERALGLLAFNNYGLSEVIGPGVAGECPARLGMHVQEDHFLVEVIDPDSLEPLPDGSEGELVFTTLTKEALPMLRYRTGDIGSLIPEPCACGRTFRRLAHLRGRRDDMIIVRGVNLYPSNVEHVLLGIPEVGPHYQIIVDRLGLMDEVTVLCEPASGDVERVALQERLKDELREQTGIRLKVEVRDIGSVPRSEGKAVRVVDRRG